MDENTTEGLNMETKVCNTCGKEKPLDEFYKFTRKGKWAEKYESPTRYESKCKSCKKQSRKYNTAVEKAQREREKEKKRRAKQKKKENRENGEREAIEAKRREELEQIEAREEAPDISIACPSCGIDVHSTYVANILPQATTY